MASPISGLRNHSDKVFNNLFSPKNPHWEKKIAEFSEKISPQKAHVIYQYRRWKAQEIGFCLVTMTDLIGVLMDCKVNYKHKDCNQPPTYYEWFYNHHTRKNDRRGWFCNTQYYDRWDRRRLFSFPPLVRKLVWRAKFCTLNSIGFVPDHVMLKLLEVKPLEIFNCFHVIEPPKGHPPILLGTIYELPPSTMSGEPFSKVLMRNGKPQFDEVGRKSHYYICDWEK